MNKLFLYKYINKLTKEDILNYSQKQNINLNNQELELIYNYIKKDFNKIINTPETVLNEIKDKVNIDIYNKLLELYDKYQNILFSLK